MIPTLRLTWLAGLAVPLALLGLFGGRGLIPFVIYDALLLMAFVFDRLMLPGADRLSVHREIPERGVQGGDIEVQVQLNWRGARAARLQLRDLPPTSFKVPRDRFDVRLRPRAQTIVRYRARAAKRGVMSFGPVVTRLRGPLRLVEREARFELPQTIRIYPDLLALSGREAALVAPTAWMLGARRGSFMGEGREFHQLRAYTPGDDPRQIDWKAYARRGSPLVREFRAERNQRVLLLINAGRLMTVRVGDRLRFDWALQAAGRLARVALGMGDLVGLAVFSRQVRRRIAASRGPGHFGRLSDVLCEVEPDMEDADLGHAISSTLRSGTRRTLVVVFSEMADPRVAEQTVQQLGQLAPRHLGLVVTLADVDLDRARHVPIHGPEAAYERLAADELWHEYRQMASELGSRGALVVRARADALAAEAVERYVEIKKTGRL